MVTSGNMNKLRPLNFGLRALREPVCDDAIARELALYDPDDAKIVSEAIRISADKEPVVDDLVTAYMEVIEQNSRLRHDVAEEELAVSKYLELISPRLTASQQWTHLELPSQENTRRANERTIAEWLALRDRELHIIKNSWRLMTRNSVLKHKLLDPIAERFLRR